MDKRGQGLSVNAIILIVLGIIVLVMLIIGFVMGWDKIMPWLKPTNNVQDVSNACSLACSTGAKYTFCFEKRELVTEDEVIEDATCYFLSKKRAKYGVEGCSIGCDQEQLLIDKLNPEDNEKSQVCGVKGNSEKTLYYLTGTKQKAKLESIPCNVEEESL